MGQIIHNISNPNDGLGEALRSAFDDQNTMNSELYNGKVDKVTGKGLTDVNFSSADKAKLDSIDLAAQVNVQSDWLQEDDTKDDYIKNRPDYLNAIGTFHYADLATQTTPINVTANTETLLTNDALGEYTSITNAPYGVPTVYNATNNEFDFSALAVGDLVHIRPDLLIDLVGTNTSYEIYMKFAIGTASEWVLNLSTSERKSTDEFKKNAYLGFDIANEDTRTAPAKMFIKTDAAATVKVNGYYLEVLRKNINLIEIQGDFIEKTSKGIEDFYGTGIIDGATSLNNKSYFRFNTGLTGLKSVVIPNNVNRYNGRDFFVTNNTLLNFTIYHNQGFGNTKFFLPNNTDFVLKPNEIAHFVLDTEIGTSNNKMRYVGVDVVSAITTQTVKNQIEISANTTLTEAHLGKTLIFTNNLNLTIPATLSQQFALEGVTLTGVTVTMVITTPHTWLFGTPAPINEKQIFTLMKRGDTNSIMLLGV